MKVAIALFELRVSPRFDCAPKMLIATVEKGKVINQDELDCERLFLAERLSHLCSSGINMLICGAIDDFSKQYLEERNVRVISWVTGETKDALNLLLKGKLKSNMIMKMGRCRGHWRLRGKIRRGARWQKKGM